MDILRDLGPLALGSRLRRLSDRIMSDVSKIYAAEKAEFEPRWFPLFSFVAEHGPAPIGVAAEAIGQTQPAISVFARELNQAGLLTITADPEDERRRLLELTETGRAMRERMKPLWRGLCGAVLKVLDECDTDFFQTLEKIERELDRAGLDVRTRALREESSSATPKLVEFRPELASHFARLNLEWIEKLFRVEDTDRALLDEPQRAIIDKGGAVFFAELAGEIVGTCGLLPEGDGEYEFIKLAVTQTARGHGVAQLLMKAAIERARELGARCLTLHSHHSLRDALHIYEKFGFRHYEPRHPTGLERTDIHMEMELTPVAAATVR